MSWTTAQVGVEPDFFRLTSNDGVDCYSNLMDSWLLDHATARIVCAKAAEGSKGNTSHSAEAKVLLAVERRPSYYMWNVVVVMFPLVGTAASVVGVPVTDLADRMSISLTLMLTAVAFKFVLMNFIPPVSYLTLLDIYVISAYVMLFLSITCNFVVTVLADGDEDDPVAKDLDLYFSAVFISIWCLFHVFIMVGTHQNRFQRSWDRVDEEIDLPIQTIRWTTNMRLPRLLSKKFYSTEKDAGKRSDLG